MTAEDYEEEAAADPIIDTLREKMILTEDKTYTEDYLDPEKRSIANAVQIHFKDGTVTDNVEVEYPLGHRFRREEAMPELRKKYSFNLSATYAKKQQQEIEKVSFDYQKLTGMAVHEFVDLFV